MDVVSQFLSNTPLWVYILFFYLLSRGIKGFKPATVSLTKLAVIPVLLTGWSLIELIRLYGLKLETSLIWIAGIGVGVGIGILLLRRAAIFADPSTGLIHRPADYTLLPLVLITFAIKYTFGVIAAVSPEHMLEPAFRFSDLVLPGTASGIFVGKFTVYLQRWMAVRKTSLP
ncbi:DUF1453 domain-containing protein [Aureimonas fodinaquatilis]|uniref:DUF1453 domain-containing protein n=1 Tax=Aureimonas fodinaquatilis TaxID=2565783 RepID=A0A5B0DZA4_9HYPH|nr:DUF1453 domain-containing protein [Aureimonas fodinaquatilis]KAA0971175.1 DUF1453 domain-containing protein [Aureimonas fodinaquatilis]